MNHDNPYRTPESGLSLSAMEIEALSGAAHDTNPIYSPRGRIGRTTFIAWAFICYNVLTVLLVVALIFVDGLVTAEAEFQTLLLTSGAAFIVALGILAIRRLHDLGRSAFQLLLLLVPLFNLYLILIMLLRPGDDGVNRFGPPRREPLWEKIVAGVALALFTLGILWSLI